MVRQLSKKVQFLQFCADLSKKSKSVKAIYIYASESSHYTLSVLRGNDGICKVLNAVTELKHPERIRSTELRKYCATVSQLADLNKTHLRWLADDMGHNIDVHREYYRLRESTVKLTMVARLLCAIDEGSTVNI